MSKLIVLVIILGLSLFAASTVLDLDLKDKGQSQINQLENSFNQLIEESNDQPQKTQLKGEERDQTNFLFLGIGGEEHVSGNYLTDTIILITFVHSTKKTAIISIPRDLLVRSPDKSYFTRINALYAIPWDDPTAPPDSQGEKNPKFPGPMGVEYTKNALYDITGEKIDYYAVLDLAGVEKIVDILGGINVRRSEDLEDNTFPDDNFGYETYQIDEGWRYLNGEEAAKYIRTRHTAGGDFDRMKRQQEVALAIKKRVEGLSPFGRSPVGRQSISGLPKLLSLYKAMQEHFTTDLSFDEIMRLMDIAENSEDSGITFERITAEKDGLLVPDTVIWGGQEAAILKPRAGEENYEEIKAKIKSIIDTLKI